MISSNWISHFPTNRGFWKKSEQPPPFRLRLTGGMLRKGEGHYHHDPHRSHRPPPPPLQVATSSRVPKAPGASMDFQSAVVVVPWCGVVTFLLPRNTSLMLQKSGYCNQLITATISHYLQGFIRPNRCRISSKLCGSGYPSSHT